MRFNVGYRGRRKELGRYENIHSKPVAVAALFAKMFIKTNNYWSYKNNSGSKQQNNFKFNIT